MSNTTVCAIFPIPIYITECDVDIKDAVDFLKKDHSLLPNSHASTYGNKSIDDYLLDHAECANLKKYIISNLEEYADKILAWNFEHFQLTQSWITIKNTHETHGIHYHPNSVLSGVFYFDEYENESSNLVFHRPLIMSQLMNQFAPSTNPEKMKDTEFPWNEWDIPPKTGQLVLFPSWLSHSVRPNTTNNIRKSLAFNAVPSGRFGSNIDATEIDFKRLA